MVTMTLSDDDASFLLAEITRRAQDIETELVHTDARAMQHDLAKELERMEGLKRDLNTARLR
jgi:hypothetical protein